MPQSAGQPLEFVGAAVVLQPDVGDEFALLYRRLRRDPRPGVGLTETSIFDEPGDAHLFVGMHDDDQGEHRRHLRFDQQRNVLDDHWVLRGREGAGDEFLASLAHQRMHDAVERLALLVVAERHRRQRWAVQRTVGQQDVGTERLDQRGKPLGARFDDLAGDDVAVDDDPAAFRERRGHRRLARSDTAGQSNAQHRNSLPKGNSPALVSRGVPSNIGCA